MGVIGNLGSRIVFETSGQKALTFSSMTQKVSGKYARHSVSGQKDRPEFTGAGNRTAALKVMVDVTLGVRPRDIIASIEAVVESGEVNYLVIGGRPMGRYYISSLSEAYDVVWGGGEIVRASLDLNLEEYV